MKKIIYMTKSVKDSLNPNLPLELTINKTSYSLTHLFLEEGQPFRKIMEEKVCKEDIENRRIRFDVGGYAEQYKDPKTGKTKISYVVSHMWLSPCMMDHRKKESGYDQMQNMYFQGKLEEYLHEQGIIMPSHNADDTERLINYLSQYIPNIWEYFKVVEKN